MCTVGLVPINTVFFCGSPVVQLCIGDEHDVGDLEHPHYCEGVTQIYISGHGLLFS